MEKQTIKYYCDLFNKEVILTVNPELNKLKGIVQAPRKLAEANESVRRLAHLLPK
jgi:hypothetical protein